MRVEIQDRDESYFDEQSCEMNEIVGKEVGCIAGVRCIELQLETKQLGGGVVTRGWQGAGLGHPVVRPLTGSLLIRKNRTLGVRQRPLPKATK